MVRIVGAAGAQRHIPSPPPFDFGPNIENPLIRACAMHAMQRLSATVFFGQKHRSGLGGGLGMGALYESQVARHPFIHIPTYGCTF